jgi:uncharacterized protein (TIGR02453 family)
MAHARAATPARTTSSSKRAKGRAPAASAKPLAPKRTSAVAARGSRAKASAKGPSVAAAAGSRTKASSAKTPGGQRRAGASAALASFDGFGRDAMQFWHELTAEMSREWFTANKARYEAQWVAPMQALMARAAAGIAPAYKPLVLGAPKVMRIHRDVRFAKDKTPYKTHIGGVISVAGSSLADGVNAALYVHLGLEEEFVGVGWYQFDAAKLAKWRKAVAGKPGIALQALIDQLRADGYRVGAHDDTKKVPKGFREDHPRAALLKMRGLTCVFPEIPRGLLHQPGLADWLVHHGRATAPLVIWLQRNV